MSPRFSLPLTEVRYLVKNPGKEEIFQKGGIEYNAINIKE